MENEEYFSGIKREYQEAIDFSSEIYANIGAALKPRLRGTVVDFGNGGVINYDTGDIDRLRCVDLVAHEPETSMPNVEFVRGDFYEYRIPDGTDAVLAQFLLHHLPDDARLDAALARLREDLGDKGRFVVVEMLLPAPAAWLQTLVRPLLYRLLGAMGKPALRFFSRASLQQRLRAAGFERLSWTRVDVGRRTRRARPHRRSAAHRSVSASPRSRPRRSRRARRRPLGNRPA